MRLVNGKLLIHLFRNGAGYLQYFDPVTGKALWEKPVFLGFGERANAFNVADGRIYFIGTGCYGALDLNSGTDIWRTNERIKSWSIFLFFRKILSTSKWRIFRVSKGGAFSLLEKFSVRNWNFILPQKRV